MTTPSEAELEAIRGKLDRAVASVCPRWLSDRREDLVQVATLRVLDLYRRSEGDRQFTSSYLWRVAYSALVDEIRRIRRLREEPLEGVVDDARDTRSPNPETEAHGREIGAAIEGCLAGMVQPRRRAVVLYLLGYGIPEAAALLAWDRKRTENLVYRGLDDLRQCLKRKGIAGRYRE